jgi:predicted transcriptional regulator
MVRNPEKFEQALAFRKRGFTLQEIAKICDVSKSTVSKWLKNNAISSDITKQNKRRAGQENAKRLKLMSKTRSTERLNQYKQIERSAETEFKHYKKDPLFIAGLMLYAAAGDATTDAVIRLSSARMSLHKTFVAFATSYLGVEKKKIKFWLLLYPTHNEEVCMKKWHKVISIPYSQSYKNHIIQGKSNKPTLHHGVGNTIIGSTVLKHKLNHWLKLVEKELTVK